MKNFENGCGCTHTHEVHINEELKINNERINNINVGADASVRPEHKGNTQKGITLLALIITIIVLLILAVVSIRLITNHDVIKYSKNATNNYSTEEEIEKIKLGLASRRMGAVTNASAELKVDGATVTGDANTGWKVKFIKSGNIYNVDKDGNINKAISIDPTKGTPVTLVKDQSLGELVIIGKPTITKEEASKYLEIGQLEVNGTEWSFEIDLEHTDSNELYFIASKFNNEDDSIETNYMYAFQDMIYETAEIKAGQWYKIVSNEKIENGQYISITTATPIDGSEIILENMTYQIGRDEEDQTNEFNILYKNVFIKIK